MPDRPKPSKVIEELSQPRRIAAVAFLVLAFLAVSLGSTDGLATLIALLCLVSASALLGWQRLLFGLTNHRWLPLWLGALLLLLIANFLASWSRQSSFPALVAIAMLPLGFIVARALGDHRWKLFVGLAVVVCSLATVSVVRLLWFQERSMWPLADPNNYATLLYLVAIPALHVFLAQQWSGQAWKRGWQVGLLLGFGLVATALFGTQSRTGMLILVGAFGCWLLIALRCRYSLRPVLLLAGVAVAAYWVSRLGIPSEIAGRFSAAELSTGLGVRLALLEAGLRLGAEQPFLGVGLFVFPLFYRTMRDGSDPVTAGYFVHNDYVQLFAEGGIFLALLFFALVVYVWVRVLKTLFVPRRHALELSAGVGLALAAAFAHAIVNFVVYVAPLALLLGFLLAEFVAQEPATKSSERAGGPPVLVLAGYGASFAIALSLLSANVASEVVLQGRLPFLVETSARSSEQQVEFAQAVATIAPARGVPALASAVFAERVWEADGKPGAGLASLLERYRAAIDADRWNPNAIYMLHQFAERRPSSAALLSPSETPEALLWRCLTIDPMYAPALERLAVLLGGQGRGDEFKDFLRVQLEPKLAIMHRENPSAAWLFHGVLMEDARQLSSAARVAQLEFLAGVMGNQEAQ